MLFGGYRVVGGLLPPGGDGERVVAVPSGPFGTATGRNEVRIARMQFLFAGMRIESLENGKFRASQSFSWPEIFSKGLRKVFPARKFLQTGFPKFFLPGYFYKRVSRSFSRPCAVAMTGTGRAGRLPAVQGILPGTRRRSPGVARAEACVVPG